jgi:hypothetical protein
MAPNIEDYIVEEVDVIQDGNTHRNPTKRHVFHTIEHIGKRDDNSDSKQRIAVIAIALVICTAIYGVLYLAMH